MGNLISEHTQESKPESLPKLEAEAKRSEPLKSNFTYVPGFDGIRCIAIFFVMLLHSSYGFFAGGWFGVDLFFVLSGFLITSLLKSEYNSFGKIRFSNFWIRRGLRLLPPLFITIILVNIFWNFFHVAHASDRMLSSAAAFFYFSNFINPLLLGPLSHLWSLSVEEHFYIFWPFIVLFLVTKQNKTFSIFFIGSFIILTSVLRILGYYYYVSSSTTAIALDPYRCSIYRMDSILFGCLLALIYKEVPSKLPVKLSNLYSYTIFVILLMILLFLDQTNKTYEAGGFILLNILSVSLIYLALITPNHIIFSNKLLRYFGKRSYGIYLYHFPIFLFLENFRINHSVINLIFITSMRFLISFFIADISYRYIERPVLKLKKFYYP